MRAIMLHEIYTEEVVGTVILKDNVSYDEITSAWDNYQEEYNSNLEEEPDIYHFVSQGNWDKCEVLEIDFYQP